MARNEGSLSIQNWGFYEKVKGNPGLQLMSSVAADRDTKPLLPNGTFLQHHGHYNAPQHPQHLHHFRDCGGGGASGGMPTKQPSVHMDFVRNDTWMHPSQQQHQHPHEQKTLHALPVGPAGHIVHPGHGGHAMHHHPMGYGMMPDAHGARTLQMMQPQELPSPKEKHIPPPLVEEHSVVVRNKASYKVDVVQRQVGDLQKQVAGMQDQMNQIEVLVQRLVSSQTRRNENAMGRSASNLRPTEEPRDLPDPVPPAELENEMTRRIDELRQINFNSTQGIHWMGVPEGNFNFPSTGFSVVATGWEQDQLPNVSLRRIEWENPKDPDEVFVKNEAQLEDGTVVSKSEEVIDSLDCAVQEDFGIPSWLFGLSLPDAVERAKDAVYDNTDWGSFENLRADRPTQPSCTNWSLLKDKLQVGDKVRLRKLKNSCSPETMKIADGTIVGMEEDKKHPQVVRVWDPGTGRGASNFRTVEEMRGIRELQSQGIVFDSEEESFSYSPEILSTANYDMPGYMELNLHHIYNALDEVVEKEGPVMLNPEFVMCDTTLHFEPLLTFSPDGFKIEYLDWDSCEDDEMMGLHWEIFYINCTGCKWTPSIGSALVTFLVGFGAEIRSIEPNLSFSRQYFFETEDFENVIYPKGDPDAVSMSKRSFGLSMSPLILSTECSIVFTLFYHLHQELKLQLEVFFSYVVLRLAQSKYGASFQQQEVALEALVDFGRQNEFMAEMYANMDCDLQCSNVFGDIANLLSKSAFPVNSPLSALNVLALDGLGVVVQAIAERTDNTPKHQKQTVPELSEYFPFWQLKCENSDDPDQWVRIAQQQKGIKRKLMVGVKHFNRNEKKGFKYLQGVHFLSEKLDPHTVALFFRYTHGLDKNLLGDYLGNHDEFSIQVLHEFAKTFDFKEMNLDAALRLLETFWLPGESQKIQRILKAFSEWYYEQSPQKFVNRDAALVLSYSVIMLNTDQNNVRVKKEMTEEDIKNCLVSFDSRQKETTDFFQQCYKWDVLTARSIGASGPDKQSPNILLDDTLLVEKDKNLLNAVKYSMVQTLRNDLRKKLVQLTFHQLVCSEYVDLLAMWLNSALTGYPIGPQGRGTVDEISTKLRGGCPSYFKESDYKYYLVVECLERASMTNNHDEREILARDAFNLLTKIPDYQRNLSDFYSHTTRPCFMKSILEGKHAAEER